jgi:hypothetical protein
MSKGNGDVFIIYFIIMAIALGLVYLFLNAMLNNK